MPSPDPDDFFDACVAEIEAEYARLQHRLGWRFLGVPKRVLRGRSRIALVSLNPGGGHEPPEHPRASCEAGNWYTTESWAGYPVGESPLQRQVRLLFQCIAERTGLEGGGDELITRSLVANFIPFRSPSYSALPHRRESLQFAHALWAKMLPRVEPTLVICLGRDAESTLLRLLPNALDATHAGAQSMPTGWGNYCATLHRFQNGSGETKLLQLPHLSRFSLFTSAKCAAPMRAIVHAACAGIG